MSLAGAEALTIDNAGVELAMSVVGDGPNVLFVHGLGSAQLLWHSIVNDLSDRYRCWLLDLRGHGASDRAPGGYDAAGYASDVAAALDHIGAPTVGVGHSLGGNSLASVGAQGHKFLAGAYLIDSAILRRASKERPAGMLRIFSAQVSMLRQFQPEDRPVDDYEQVLAAAPYVGGGTNADHMTPTQLRGRAQSLSLLDPECFDVVIEGRQPAVDIAPAMTIPLRVISADANLGASFRPADRDEVAKLCPQATFRELSGVGHQTLMIRGYDIIVRDDLINWLGEQDLSPASTETQVAR